MKRPSPAILGAVALHAGLIGLFFLPWPEREPMAVVMATPVSIVSETEVIEAAAPDNPSEELVTGEETPPPPPETPPEPEPTPPRPTPTPTPTPARRPAPEPPTTRQPPPKKDPPPRRDPPREESWDPSSVTSGSSRRDRSRQPQPPTGQQGRGSEPRAVGRADLQALGAQVRPIFNCDLPGASEIVVRVTVTLTADGRIVGAPRLERPGNSAAYRAVSDSVIRGVRAAVPFDMPAGYEQQDLTFAFQASNYCN